MRVVGATPAQAPAILDHVGIDDGDADGFQSLQDEVIERDIVVDLPERAGVDALGALSARGVDVAVFTNSFESTDVWIVH